MTPADQTTLDAILGLISQRAPSYEIGVQTTIRWKSQSGWLNAITKVDFVRKSENVPAALHYEYANLRVHRRLHKCEDVGDILRRLLGENALDLGKDQEAIALQPPCTFSMESRTRRPHSEWCSWPAEVFRVQPGQ